MSKSPMQPWTGLCLVLCLLNLTGLSCDASAAESRLRLLADGLDLPVNLASPDDGSGRTFVLEQFTGKIRVIQQGQLLPEPFLDIGHLVVDPPMPEEGLLGLALAPGFPESPYVYVSYVDQQKRLALSRFEVTADGTKAVASSATELLSVPNDVRMHYCGHLTFGPDGYLYWCVGDGQGNALPSQPFAQDLGGLRGKLLRLDVSNPDLPYAVPPDNPLVEVPGARPEIWAYGLRNPWRFSFDPADGTLFVPDVGRYHWEELNVMDATDPAGANFGWPMAEGNECLSPCDGAPLTWPIHDYWHNEGCSIIGGEVYRGQLFPEWQGLYIYGDYCGGVIWAMRNAGGKAEVKTLLHLGLVMSAIGNSADGEILVLDKERGEVYQLELGDDVDDGWESVEFIGYHQMLAARREGYGRADEALRKNLRSRRWRWTAWVNTLRQLLP